MTAAIYSVHSETWTPEAVEAGDTDNRDTLADREPLAPDAWEKEEADEAGLDPVVYLAVEVLRQWHATEPSHSGEGAPCWFTTADPDRDYTTGAETTHSVHFDGLTPVQWNELHAHRPR